MKFLGYLLNLLFKLPVSIKLKLAGGKATSIRGNTLDTDTQMLALNNARGPQLHNMPPVKARKLFQRMSRMIQGNMSKHVTIKNTSIALSERVLPARLYTPTALLSKSPLLLYFHGGGNVIGDLDSYDVLCGDFAEQLNIRVLSVDYRLAPEYKFPAAALDAYASYCWARDNAENLNIDSNNILVAGDSAGGYLSCVCSLQAIQHGTEPPKAQILIYPMADMRMETESHQLFGENLVLTHKLMEYFINHYLNEESEKINPLASPVFADEKELAKMPPTLVTLAGFDPLYDEGKALYEKMKTAGVNIQLITHDDLTHGFITMTGVLNRGNVAKDEIIAACKQFLN